MCAKADYWSENEITLGQVMFSICGFAAVATIIFMFLFMSASRSVAPELPEYKIEPVTTITARP